jgi:bifunctional UDP-N-acetylglucosamine pyrophosphorylase/glucosamine-1-phosphate N-acetyltransferase
MDNCAFGAGAVTANFRFDEGNIGANVNGKRLDSGRDKLGCLMGSNCKVGINASLMPGVKIGPNAVVGSGVVLDKDLDDGLAVFAKPSHVTKKSTLRIERDKKAELMKRIIGKH